MALRRRRRDDFTNSLNNFQSHNSLKPIVGKKCDINLSNDKNIGNNVFAIENKTKDYSLISQNKISDESYKKFDNVLFVLDSKLNPTEANLTKQEIYKRLSEKCVTSPQKFTERLITIIEESIINNTINASNNSLINFNQISKELNKMCNNIENESMPEKLLSSTINISPNREISKIANSNDSINSAQITNDNYCTDVKTLSSINLNSCKMRTPSPIKNGKKVYRKTPINVFKTQNKRLRDVSLLPSISTDSSFEYLEAQCERLFPNEKKNPISVSTVQDNNSFLTMDRVFTICEQQMASLNSTDDIKIRKKNKNSIEELKRRSKDSGYSHLYSIPESSVYKDEDKNKKLKKVTHKRCKRELDTEYLNSADDLNKSLLSEIVIKRRRCLDTAKKMMEINSECNNKMKGEKKSKAYCKSIVDINSNKPKDNDKHFMKILMSCEDYHNYLDDQLTILDASSINSTFDSTINELNKNNKINKNNNKNNINVITSTKKAFTRSNPSISYNENYEKVLARWNIRENIEKISDTVLKNNNNSHFFTTPGKMLTKEKHKRKMYFSDSYITKKQISPLKISTNRNSNYNTKLSLGRIYKNENLKSKRGSLRKLSKQNVTSISKNKENKK